jgi:hypothetical protein
VLVHLSVNQGEIRSQVANGACEIGHRHRFRGLTAALSQAHEPHESSPAGVRREKRFVSARLERKELETLMLDETSGRRATGESHSMARSV